jgi:hypothetical protein
MVFGLHDGVILQEHPRLTFGCSASGDQFAVSPLHFVFFLGGMEGGSGKDCASPWLWSDQGLSNSLRDRIYDVKSMGRYDEAPRTARCQWGPTV